MNDSVGLEFSFKEFADEVQVMRDLAEDLLTQEAILALKTFETDIRQLASLPTDSAFPLELAAFNGRSVVRTRLSKGEYERGKRKGEMEVFAELSCSWRVMPVGSRKQKRRRPRFRLAGLASTAVSIWSQSGERLLSWHVDIASSDSPGCHFHIQVTKSDEKSRLPVPRFPSVLVTPMAALDFVLGELFQDDWLKLTSRTDANALRWRRIQQVRWEQILGWYLQHVKDRKDTCSPWLGIKNRQPPNDLFLER